VGIAEVDLNAGVAAEALVGWELLALVPVSDFVTCAGSSAMRALSASSTCAVVRSWPSQGKKHIAGLALDQRRDRRLAARTDQQVALPVAGDAALVDLWRALGDRDHLRDSAAGVDVAPGAARRATRFSGPQSAAGAARRATRHTATGKPSRG
jgi:hypothetical protein